MPDSPLISVIVPVYNTEAFLEECLNSILQQTLHHIEVICVDDGSTDQSLKLLQKLAEGDSRIVIISRENRGVSASRNEAMQHARGKYLAFIDSDDLFPEKDILEALYTKAEEHQVLVCGGEFSEFSENKPNLCKNFPQTVDGFLFPQEGVIKYEQYQFDYGFSRFIYDRRMLLDNHITFPAYTRFEDPPFFVKAMLQAKRFYALKKTVYAYRRLHKPSIWKKKHVEDLFNGLRENWELACAHHYKKLQEYCYFRIQDFYPLAKEHIQSDDITLIQEIEKRHIKSKLNIGRWIFSKKKSSLDNNLRYFTILGLTLSFLKRK